MELIIRNEKPDDITIIRKVNEAAFDTSAEAGLVDALRDNDAISLSLVALLNESIVGLGPMSILPAYQGRGIGSRLVEAGLETCTTLGHAAVVVLGHPEFYPRFGFVPSTQYGIISEYDVPPEVFMVKELVKNTLKGRAGTAKYHQLFNEL
jgi:putative acetyltransferase